MEAFGEANGQSLSDSFSLYERYMKSFNVVDTFSCNKLTYEEIVNEPLKTDVPLTSELDDCTDVAECADDEVGAALNTYNQSDLLLYEKKSSSNDLDFHSIECESLRGNLSSTCDYSFTDKLDLPGTSEDSKSDNSHHPKPVIITSLITMENSNNAVDSNPLFRPLGHTQNVFKLPCELTFNGTLKHVQKLKPIVDPITALNSSNIALTDQEDMQCKNFTEENESSDKALQISEDFNQAVTKSDIESRSNILNDKSDESSKLDGVTCMSDSQYSKSDREKWSDSYSSVDTSFDSGLRSPDMFSDGCDEDEAECESAKFWDFIHEFETYDKCKIKKMEESLQGVPPPPSVTLLKTDVNDMLKKYYTYLPNFGVDSHINSPDNNSVTPTKHQVFIRIPTIAELNEPKQEIANESSVSEDNVEVPEEKISIVNYVKQSEAKNLHSIKENTSVIPALNYDPMTQEAVVIKTSDGNLMGSGNTSKVTNTTNKNEKSESSMNKSTENVTIQMCTENEARDTPWPQIIKCRFYDLHYNITRYSERIEQLAVKCSERFVGCDTDSTVTVYSGNSQSPSSATKRKAMRLKMAQAKSPGRRLSHLARRRQTFYSAANIGQRAHNSTSRMVLIDKKKLVNTSDRKSPRNRRTPGKKTPAKTPKSKSGGSSKKKAMRRLLLDHELTRSQPTRDSSRRALFISPEQRKSVPIASTSSVPVRAFKSKRALFSSPDAAAETKSEDGTRSDNFLKRKCSFDTESRHKMAKSLSFGGDCINSQPSGSTAVSRRASEMFSTKSMMAELDAQHRKKLLWAVSEALRIHGWRMQSSGFREKASALAQLTRRILTLPQHANRLNSPHVSTSDTLFKLARLHVFSIIQGKSIEECFQDEKVRLSEQAHRMAVYAANSMYQQRPKPSTSTTMSQVKENLSATKQEQPKSTSKNVLQDKVVNIDSNSNSSSGLSMLDKTALFKSNSMPSFEEAAKMRARRQISFDNVDFPKR